MDRMTSTASVGIQRIFDNIIFLEEVFVGRGNQELPEVPFIELARCFELKKREASFSDARRRTQRVPVVQERVYRSR